MRFPSYVSEKLHPSDNRFPIKFHSFILCALVVCLQVSHPPLPLPSPGKLSSEIGVVGRAFISLTGQEDWPDIFFDLMSLTLGTSGLKDLYKQIGVKKQVSWTGKKGINACHTSARNGSRFVININLYQFYSCSLAIVSFHYVKSIILNASLKQMHNRFGHHFAFKAQKCTVHLFVV